MSIRAGSSAAPIPSELSPVKRALLEIRKLRSRLADLENASREPIAIVGIGMRAPGKVHDTTSYAELLWAGRTPSHRFPRLGGRSMSGMTPIRTRRAK